MEKKLDSWNNAFAAFFQCQPCKTMDIAFMVASDGSYQRDSGSNDDGKEFDCSNSDNYGVVNQCMRFKATTEMLSASYKDIQMAGAQGTITSVKVGTHKFGKLASRRSLDTLVYRGAWAGMVASGLLFLIATINYFSVKADRAMTEPLVPSSGVSA